MLGTSLPYGLRDVKITPYDDAGELTDPVDLPNARTFSFEENEDYEQLRGDDKVVAEAGQGPTVSWELEGGGISLEAYAAINGGTVTVSGVSPNQVKKYSKKTTDKRPRFKVEGQALSESGGDFHPVLYNAKATDGVSGELGDGAFWLTGASGSAIGHPDTDELYDFVQNETAKAIASVSTGATAGSPGTWAPSGSLAPSSIEALEGVTPSPSTAWTTGQHVLLRDGTTKVYWDGNSWEPGQAS